MIKMPPVKTSVFALNGGLDLVTPPISIKNGFCTESKNYEIGLQGGYRRIDGYERFDGRDKPSNAAYYTLPVAYVGAIPNGSLITGATSGATGYFIGDETNIMVLTKVTGTFTLGENLQVSGVTKATVTGSITLDGASTNQLHWYFKNAAADIYRDLIQPVPGSGSILGVWLYNDTVYAFRNASDGLSAKMYKATTGGWVEIVTGVTLDPDGRYEFVNYNFGSGLMMYGCDGVNKAFQFDGTTFTQITTGMSPDKPKHIAGHVNHLFLSFDSSLQNSAISNPLSWTPVSGAGEINVGETITNLVPQPGDANGPAMAIWSRNGTFMLYGTGTTTWKFVTLQSTTGAFHYTAQYMDTTFVLDDRGITTLEAVQEFGNFAAATISDLVRPFLIENKGRVVASGVSKDKNQYRLFFNSGRALYYTLRGGFMEQEFAHPVTCYYSGEDSDGVELLLSGSTNGFVYQQDIGTSFDGEPVTAYVQLAFNHFGSPQWRKFFRRFTLEVQGAGYSDFLVSADLGYGSGVVDAIPMEQMLVSGRWDNGNWDTGVWDGKSLAPTSHELGGTAENIALRFTQTTDYQTPMTLFSVMVDYSLRRQLRG